LDKKIYGCSGDLGAMILRCLDLENGKLNWEERLPGRASLLAVDDRLLIREEHGSLDFIAVNPAGYRSLGEGSDRIPIGRFGGIGKMG